ncbi:MAG: HNH endonuclease [Anaerolineae bacterium]|nr:HNH endonuclease [Anaerolineae bacterium]
MSRNPNWTRDELILALDLYISEGGRQLESDHPKVIELSQLLNKLPIHDIKLREAKFRNPNGVSMKLGNFLSIDPAYIGAGLTRGSKLEQEVWDEFASEPYRLKQIASAIRLNYLSLITETKAAYEVEIEDEFNEGRILTRLHRQRERNPQLTKRKKEKVLKQKGALACEVCEFDFAQVYGELGYGFAECHHLVPLSKLGENQRVRLSDLAIVCANCHRMLHRGKSLLTMGELKKLVKK